MRKFRIYSLFFVLFTFSLRVSAQEVIRSLNSDFIVGRDGTVSVTETIEYDFGNAQKHGIYRNIPFIKVNEEGKRLALTLNDISVKDLGGNSHKFTQSKSGDEVVLKIGDPNATVTGINYYVINYNISGALTYFETFDEFYWNSIGPNWNVDILSSPSTVTFDSPFKQGELSGKCYTGKVGSTEQDCTVENISNGLKFTTSNVRPGEAFTTAVVFPKGYAEVLEPREEKMPLLLMIIFAIIGLLLGSFYFILPTYFLIKWNIEKKRLKDTARIVSAWFSAPKTPSGNNLTPVETVMTADITPGTKATTATIISLAQRGYITITQQDSKVFAFSKTSKETDGELRDYEKSLYDAMFKSGDIEVTTKDLSKNTTFATASVSLGNKAGSYLQKSKVFQKNPNSISQGYMAMTAISFVFFNIYLALVAFFLGRKSPRRTSEGIQTYSEAVSLKNFLVSQDPQFDFQAQEMMFFEKLLPYASAFGVEDIWLKRFKDLFSTPPEWYKGNDIARMAVLNSVVNRSVHAASPSGGRSSSGFSSGFSGGSSGGGGGGGGGGSW